MGHESAIDHLELWRGIDDAVWREALRPTAHPPATRALARPPRLPVTPPEPAGAREPEQV